MAENFRRHTQNGDLISLFFFEGSGEVVKEENGAKMSGNIALFFSCLCPQTYPLLRNRLYASYKV